MAKLGIVANNKEKRKWFSGSEYNPYNWNKVKRKRKKKKVQSVLYSDLNFFYHFINKNLEFCFFKKNCQKFDGYELQWQI